MTILLIVVVFSITQQFGNCQPRQSVIVDERSDFEPLASSVNANRSMGKPKPEFKMLLAIFPTGNEFVDLQDLTLLLANWTEPPTGPQPAGAQGQDAAAPDPIARWSPHSGAW